MPHSLNRLVYLPWIQRKSVKGRLASTRRRSSRKLLFEGLEERRLLAVVGRVVEDAVPLGGVNNGDLGSSPSGAVEAGGTVYFSADDGLNGQELWRINAGGFAELVEDTIPGGGIADGPASSNPSYLTNFNGTVFFSADDGVNGTELWRVGSSGVAELVPGALAGGINPGSASSYPKNFQEVNGSLYFQARDSANGVELWRTSSAGTPQLVEDSTAGGGIRFGAQSSEPRYLTNVAGQLFFQATDGTNGAELWRVQNGGLASLVEDSSPGGGIAPSFEDSDPSNLINFNGTLYFTATNNATGTELWRVSGGGLAQLVENSIPGGGIALDADSSTPSYLTRSGGTLYFQATNEDTGYELWRIGLGGLAEVVETSSTPNGGINPGVAGATPTKLTDVSGTLYFSAQSDTEGYELWRVNGSGFAELVDDNAPGTGIAPGTESASPNYLANVNGTLFFAADDGIRGIELWKVPGAGNAEIVEDAVPGGGIAIGAANSSPKNLINVNGQLFFAARNQEQGLELWRVDAGGIARVIESAIPGDGINPSFANSNPMRLSNLNGTLFFAANDGIHGEEFWRINTALKAVQVNAPNSVKGVNALSASSSPIHPTVLNGSLFFVASDGVNGTELWRLNSLGIAEIVEDNISGGGIRAGVLDANPRDLVEVNGTVYFSAATPNGTGIWRILPSGLAELVVETLARGGVDTGATTPRSHLLTNANGTLFFVAADASNGNELWRINASGTAEVVEDGLADGGINPGTDDSYPRQLMNVNGTLYFRAEDPAAGDELWRVNGAVAERVEDVVPSGGINPGTYGSAPSDMVNFLGTLYFQANDGTNGRELWRVNAGGIAELVEDNIVGGGINPDTPFPNSSYPTFMTAVGGTLYFQANNGVDGEELWRVIGSNPAEIVEDNIAGGGINPGIASSNPRDLTNVNGTLYFRAENVLNGRELWRVNPATGIAELVEDSILGGGIRPGNGHASPSNLSNLNGTLYFRANDGTNGYEVWRINGSNAAELVEDPVPGGGIQAGLENSDPSNFAFVGGTAYFTATSSNHGVELFAINPQGLAISVSGEDGNGEILPGPESASPRFLTNFNNVLYFSANAGSRFGNELMKLKTNAVPNLTRNNPVVTGDVLSPLTNSGTWNDLEGDAVSLMASIGNIVRNANGTWNWTFTPTTKLVNQPVQITAIDIHGESSNVVFTITADVRVRDQRIFYNRATSVVFGNGSGNPIGAIDPTKSALLAGQTTSFDNVSNYRFGLNGLVIDVAGLGSNTSASDLQFSVWNGIDAGGFVATVASPTITHLPGGGVGGSTRLKIEFANNAIQNTWLRVTLLANANTGLNANHTFVFGSAIAEMNFGNVGEPLTLRVNASDTSRVRQNQSISAESVPVTSLFDVNKDGRVNATDTSIVRQNQLANVLRYFTAPSSAFLASTIGVESQFASAPTVESMLSKTVPSVLPSSVRTISTKLANPSIEQTSVASKLVVSSPFKVTPVQLTSNKPTNGQSAHSPSLADSTVWDATDLFFASYKVNR